MQSNYKTSKKKKKKKMQSNCHFGETRHNEIAMTAERGNSIFLPSEVVVKEEYRLNEQPMVSNNGNASIIFPDGVNHLQELYEDLGEDNQSLIKELRQENTAVNEKQNFQRKRAGTIEGIQITPAALQQVVHIKNEPIFDDEDMEFTKINAIENTSPSLDANVESQDKINFVEKSATSNKDDAVLISKLMTLEDIEPVVDTKNEPISKEDEMEFTFVDVSGNNDAQAEAKPTTQKPIEGSVKKQPKLYYCDVCPKSFKLEKYLNAHSLLHKGVQAFLCTHEYCDKSFSTENAFREHLNKHKNPNTVYTCDQEGCDKVYTYKFLLTKHKKYRHNLGSDCKVYKCELCGKEYKEFSPYNSHMYKHKGVYPYVCDQPNCNLGFPAKHLLDLHLMRHAGVKKYKCLQCDFGTMRKCELTRHMEKYHNNKYPCARCKEVFDSRSGLITHKKNEHNIVHTKGENDHWPCRLCEEVLKSFSDFKTHRKDFHPKRYFPCRHCDQIFAWSHSRHRHEYTHTGGELNLFCSICGKGFAHPRKLHEHEQFHERQMKKSAVAKKCE